MFNQNDVVNYKQSLGLGNGRGRIVGKTHSPISTIGEGYIVEDLSGKLPNDVYPFTHFSCSEIFLEASK